MTTKTVGNAIAKRDENKPQTTTEMVQQYRNDFATVLPSHIKAATWVRVATGALKKGDKDRRTGMTKLEAAARNNPAAFFQALLDAARLGLEPGTEQYYLTPRKNKNNGGREEILGIPGYQGYIELMYRAGAISSVVAEVVYTGDKFSYLPGRDERPQHEIDWDSDNRGELRLAYAYAVMKDGATSRVVVLNRKAIDRVKRSSQGADSDYSPWKAHAEAMWLKTAVRQLAKWVPTSAEYITAQRRAEAEATPGQTMADMKQLGPEWVEADQGDEFHGEVEGEIIGDHSEELAELEAEQAATSSGVDADAFGGGESS
jgi:recombination protein RecT